MLIVTSGRSPSYIQYKPISTREVLFSFRAPRTHPTRNICHPARSAPHRNRGPASWDACSPTETPCPVVEISRCCKGGILRTHPPGAVLRYSKGSNPLGIEPGEYARLSHVNRESNTLTVKWHGGEELSYDPRRLQGVTVYRDSERKFAQGDRVQLTAPFHEQKLANRELATIERIEGDGNLKLRTDSGREVEFNARQHPHLDYGYAVTSHSSQGQTAERVLIHVDTEQAPGELANSRMAYVSVSRAQFDVKMYTNDATM